VSIKNVLLIAPRTNLAFADAEVTEVVNVLRPRLYQGVVTVDGNIDYLREKDQGNNPIRWDLVYFIAHGHGDGIELSNGELLTVGRMTQVVKSAPGAAWFLNTCDTAELANRIHSQVKAEFVFSVKEVPDIDAFLVAKILAWNIASGKSLLESYLEARQGENTSLMYLPGDPASKKGNRGRMTDLLDDARFEKMSEELERVIDLIDGSKRYNTVGIIPTIKMLGERQERQQASIFFLRITFALIMVINFFMLLAIVFLIYDI
jgi:hypothetical protein